MSNWSLKELLEWVNEFLHLDIPNITQLGNGAAYVQLIDSLHPGQADLELINWQAESQSESVRNVKILQTAMARHGLQHKTNFEQLAKGNVSENLEFLRFLKTFWDNNYLTEHYDPVGRREECMALKRRRSSSSHRNSTSSTQRTPSKSITPLPLVEIPEEIMLGYRQIFDSLGGDHLDVVYLQDVLAALNIEKMHSNHPVIKRHNIDDPISFAEFVEIMADPSTDLSVQNPHPSSSTGTSPRAPETARSPAAVSRASEVRRSPSGLSGEAGYSEQARKEIAGLKKQMAEEVKISIELEKERDFYYNKLQQVEVICQQRKARSPDRDLINKVLETLWEPRK